MWIYQYFNLLLTIFACFGNAVKWFQKYYYLIDKNSLSTFGTICIKKIIQMFEKNILASDLIIKIYMFISLFLTRLLSLYIFCLVNYNIFVHFLFIWLEYIIKIGTFALFYMQIYINNQYKSFLYIPKVGVPKNNILSNTPANKDTYIILMNWSFLLIKRSLIWHQTCQWLDSLKNWPRWPWQLTYKLKVYCNRATITRFGKNKRKCVCYHKDCHKKRKKSFL